MSLLFITKTFHIYYFTDQQVELLTNLRAEKESLLQKLYTAEQRCAETEVIM